MNTAKHNTNVRLEKFLQNTMERCVKQNTLK